MSARVEKARKRKPLSPDQTQRLMGWLRIGDLNRVLADNHGGTSDAYAFPDDDSGNEDLIILLQHYSHSDPLAVPRIIKRRAPWMSGDRLQRLYDHLAAYPRLWKAETLGRELRVTKEQRGRLDLRTIAAMGTTKEQRRRDSRARHRERMNTRRRKAGMPTRREYLAKNRISHDKPWEAAGMSRAKWYRRRKSQSQETPQSAVRQVCSHKAYLSAVNGLVSQDKDVNSNLVGRTTTTVVGGAEPWPLALSKRRVSNKQIKNLLTITSSTSGFTTPELSLA
jgi:hypothetical protein